MDQHGQLFVSPYLTPQTKQPCLLETIRKAFLPSYSRRGSTQHFLSAPPPVASASPPHPPECPGLMLRLCGTVQDTRPFRHRHQGHQATATQLLHEPSPGSKGRGIRHITRCSLAIADCLSLAHQIKPTASVSLSGRNQKYSNVLAGSKWTGPASVCPLEAGQAGGASFSRM